MTNTKADVEQTMKWSCKRADHVIRKSTDRLCQFLDFDHDFAVPMCSCNTRRLEFLRSLTVVFFHRINTASCVLSLYYTGPPVIASIELATAYGLVE